MKTLNIQSPNQTNKTAEPRALSPIEEQLNRLQTNMAELDYHLGQLCQKMSKVFAYDPMLQTVETADKMADSTSELYDALGARAGEIRNATTLINRMIDATQL